MTPRALLGLNAASAKHPNAAYRFVSKKITSALESPRFAFRTLVSKFRGELNGQSFSSRSSYRLGRRTIIMEGFSAIVSTAQAVTYAWSIGRGLARLQNALKNGHGFLHSERASIGLLQEIIQLIPTDETKVDPGLDKLLQSMKVTIDSLLALLNKQKTFHLVVLLILRRTEVNESFASLERKKNLLILYFTAQNSAALASLKDTKILPPTPATKMPQQSQSHFQVRTSISSSFAALTPDRIRAFPPLRLREPILIRI